MRTSYQSYSADQWQQIMRDYSRSGLNQKAFCQQAGLAMSTFSKWRKQLGLVNSDPEAEAIADFKPLMPVSALSAATVAESSSNHAHWDMELVLGTGITLRLRSGV